MKKSDVFSLIDGLNRHKPAYVGAKLAYAVARNCRKLQEEAKDLLDARKGVLGEFDEELEKLQEKHAKKDEDGRALRTGTDRNQILLEDPVAYVKAVEKLRKKYEKQLDEWEELLKTVVSFELHKVNSEELPEDISAEAVEFLLDFLE